MKRIIDFLWPAMGFVAVVVSIWLLSREFKGEAVASQVWQQLASLSFGHYLLAIACALLAYAALAWYDRIALLHLQVRSIPLAFVAICSFTTYALSHTIGFSVFSGALVRYRAYSSRGLSAAQIAVLVVLCSITFGLGSLLVGGLVLVSEPQELGRIGSMLPHFLTDRTIARIVGVLSLGACLAYLAGSVIGLPAMVLRGVRIEYPTPAIAVRQFLAATIELVGAAGILYFALPSEGNPGYLVVLAMFLGSFLLGLASNAPGQIGVFEYFFVNALHEIPKAKVLAAVLMFRLFYLLIPLAFSIVVVVLFERHRLDEAIHRKPSPDDGSGASRVGSRNDKATHTEAGGVARDNQ